MRVLVTGAAGQLGTDLVAACERAGDDVVGVDRATFDVGDRRQAKQVVSSVSPEVVINAAAWTDVDACEGDPGQAMHVNGYGVEWLREACDSVGAHLVQISTDYVFDGRLDRPYVETDDTNPLSVYGKSKLFGEDAAGPEATIVRTSWVCGAAGRNMVKTVLRLLETHDSLSFVDDQRGCPTFTADLAPLVRRLAVERRAGVFHATNQGPVSWYEFVRARSRDGAPGRDSRVAAAPPGAASAQQRARQRRPARRRHSAPAPSQRAVGGTGRPRDRGLTFRV